MAVQVPDGECTYVKSRDCPDVTSKGWTQKEVCIDGAVRNYTAQLATSSYNGAPLKDSALADALKFLVHFIGPHKRCSLGLACSLS